MHRRRIEARLQALEKLAATGEGILLILDADDAGSGGTPRDGMRIALADPGESTEAVVARVAGGRRPEYVIRRRIVHPIRDTIPSDTDETE